MPSYISTNANRLYCGLETAFGQVPTVTTANRISAVKLVTAQESDLAVRKDKTGSRTFGGQPTGGRLKTTFELKTYMNSWVGGASGPSSGPLFQAAMGATPIFSSGGSMSTTNGTQLGFASPHGLVANQAVSSNGEIRFVAAVLDASTIVVNAPFTHQLTTGAQLAPTITYLPATELPSVSIFDYWSPSTAVQRTLVGAAVDKMSLDVNGDYHEFDFSGTAKDILDSSSFASGQGELTAFPAEPPLGGFDLAIVPGLDFIHQAA